MGARMVSEQIITEGEQMSLAVEDLGGSINGLSHDLAVFARDGAAVAENEQKLGIA
jgi:hypothetical protein